MTDEVSRDATPDLIKARLNKKNDRVVQCASCGQQLGYIVEYSGRRLAFDEAWQQRRDGSAIWWLPPRAVEYARRGKRPKLRRPIMPAMAEMGAVLLRPPEELPARVQCWRCGVIQVLDPADLRVEVLQQALVERERGFTLFLAAFDSGDEKNPLEVFDTQRTTRDDNRSLFAKQPGLAATVREMDRSGKPPSDLFPNENNK